MTSEEYLLDNDWKMARERLAPLERDRDYATIQVSGSHKRRRGIALPGNWRWRRVHRCLAL
jgi:hypothetical protein